jgi:hypothetical protein
MGLGTVMRVDHNNLWPCLHSAVVPIFNVKIRVLEAYDMGAILFAEWNST